MTRMLDSMRRTSLAACVWAAWILAAWSTSGARAEDPLDLGDAQWIWSPEHAKDRVPASSCYFRKAIFIGTVNKPLTPERGRLEVSADDGYTAYVNGRQVGEGKDFRELGVFDVTKFLTPGLNVVAIKVDNATQGPAGLVARITVKHAGNTDVQTWTDTRWKTSLTATTNWASPRYDDSRWAAAVSYGEFGSATPWADAVRPKKEGEGGRFRVVRGFAIERIAKAEQTQSLVAMTFDPRGRIIASRERGPLLVIADADSDGRPDVRVLTENVVNCQGLLAYRQYIYAVGDGPLGTAFYQLTDEKGTGVYDKISLMYKFEGGMSEHGPHAPVLGPDGLIYLVSGNHVKPGVELDPKSPYGKPYEGDLVQPRYEDPGGHAVGIQAPGGVILRSSLDGRKVELFAGGLRNCYDLAFNRAGDLFTFESDMEWDESLPWYRPTRVLHLASSGDFGWRSGWAKWPEYFHDSLPSALEVGRGSPSGLAFYDHHKFPQRYHGALFVADWSMGRIAAVFPKPQGASYVAQAEAFLEGRPLNATDIEIGPDGWLYFCTGGRDTEGGVYRIVWTGQQPAPPADAGILAALHQPHLTSAWSLRRIEQVKKQLAAEWPKQLSLAAQDGQKYQPAERVRALDIMQLVGPPASKEFLILLSKDKTPEVQAKAAYLMGLHSDEATHQRLLELLDDKSPVLRRVALESIERSGQTRVSPGKVASLLADADRHVAWAAGNLLKKLPVASWSATVLRAREAIVFNRGSVALLAVDPRPETAKAVLARGSEILKGYVSDADFLMLLRTMQVALYQGQLTGKDVPALRAQLAAEYPLPTDKNPAAARRVNRELLRLLTHLQVGEIVPGLLATIGGKEPFQERLHAAAYAHHLERGWTIEQKITLLGFYEDARREATGHSSGGYLDAFTKQMVQAMTVEERIQVLAQGADLPSAVVFVLATLPVDPGDEIVQYLIDLDDAQASAESPAARRLQTAIAAVLARSKQPQAMAHLREVFQSSPQRRESLALALAQEPSGPNWPLLVQSLAVVEGATAQEVLEKLSGVERSPGQPQAYRQAILKALQLGESGGGKQAIAVLERWTGETLGDAGEDFAATVADWQKWFRESYPDHPPAVLDEVSNRYSLEDILQFMHSDEGRQASAERGAKVFEKATCVKCHRYDGRGEGIGPDLTTVARRFHFKEIVQSVLVPSQVISDQYVAKTVVTLGGKSYTGIVGASGAKAVVVLQANGEKQIVEKDDIEQILPSPKSAMPDGLFNNLTLEEIADLLAYLTRSGPSATTASGGNSAGRN